MQINLSFVNDTLLHFASVCDSIFLHICVSWTLHMTWTLLASCDTKQPMTTCYYTTEVCAWSPTWHFFNNALLSLRLMEVIMRKQTMVPCCQTHTRYITIWACQCVFVCVLRTGAARAVMDGPSPYRKIHRLRIFSFHFSLLFTGTCVKHHCMAHTPTLQRPTTRLVGTTSPQLQYHKSSSLCLRGGGFWI